MCTDEQRTNSFFSFVRDEWGLEIRNGWGLGTRDEQRTNSFFSFALLVKYGFQLIMEHNSMVSLYSLVNTN